MIQRIQTLYMLAVTALVCVVLLVPMARFGSPDGDFSIMSYGLRSLDASAGSQTASTVVSWWSVCTGVLLAVCALLPLVTVFLYKHRLLQIRLLAAECVLVVCALFFAAYYLWSSFQKIAQEASDYYITYTLLLLIAAFVLCVLAVRAVGRDEALVRSLDRIR